MIDDQKFNCPACGAPGETIGGQAQYSCMCRFAHVFRMAALPPQPLYEGRPLCSCPPGTACLNVACPYRSQVTCDASRTAIASDDVTTIDSSGRIHGPMPLTFRRDLGGHY